MPRPRGQSWTSAVLLPQGRHGLNARQMAVWLRFTRPLWVAPCPVNSCAACGSICPLSYPQLLATKEITSRDTVGLIGINLNLTASTETSHYDRSRSISQHFIWFKLIYKGQLAPLETAPFSVQWARKRYRVAQRFCQY